MKVSELLESWRAKLGAERQVQVTVRIEEESPAMEDATSAFGIWRGWDDPADVEGYARRLRAPRFGRA